MRPFLIATLFAIAIASVHAEPLSDPLKGDGLLTSGFGPRTDPFTGRQALHQGQDFAGALDTPVFAARSGRVTVAERRGPSGNFVEIDHGGGVVTRYAQLNRFSVAAGQTVSAGDPIATMGNTGRSTGPHLHFEVVIDGQPVDPLLYLPARKPRSNRMLEPG